jgi:SAM-dependent methyltransferase
MRLRFLISPFFLSRTLLRRAIARAVASTRPTGSLMDVGCGEKPHQDLFPGIQKYQGIDFQSFSANKDFHSGKPDYAFPPEYTKDWTLPFPDASYDHVAAFEVAEHHPQPAKLLSEIQRILRPGGYAYVSWPFIFPLHEEPHDHFRYTHHQMAFLATNAGLESVEFYRTGGLIPTLVTLICSNLAVFHDRGGWRKIAALLVYPPVLLLQYIALPFSSLGSSTTILTYVAVLRKPQSSARNRSNGIPG